jgi:formylglycine-generating enzyme required for sulfatase activity
MAGNVWEWCRDWYADGYAGQPIRNPAGPQTGTSRVMRGGSWFYRDPKNFRCARRKHLGPWYHNYDRGFRLAGGPSFYPADRLLDCLASIEVQA